MKRSVLVAAFLFLCGCGESGPALVSVTGTVTLNNKPLEGAVIQFLPDTSNQEGQPGEDETGPSGNYKARTRGRSGLVPGKYRVVITKNPTAPAQASEDFKDDPYMAQVSVQEPELPNNRRAAAAKKKAAEKVEGEFTADVEAKGSVLDFDVKSRVKDKPST